MLQGYTWRKSGGDGVMCQLCAIAVVVMCGGCTEKKKKLTAHFSVAVV